MPEMISPTDQTVVSMSGHSVEFKAGEPTWVVPQAARDASRAGAVLAENFITPETAPEETAPEETAPEETTAPTEPVEDDVVLTDPTPPVEPVVDPE